MKFTIKAGELNSALKATAELLKDKKTNPILSYYLFKLEDDTLIIRTSQDDGTTISVAVNVDKDMTEEYSFLVPQKIKEIAGLISGDVEFDYNPTTTQVVISHKCGNTELGCQEATAFPEAEFKTDTEEYTATELDGETLSKGIAFCLPFVSDSPIRPQLGSVHIEIKDGNIHFAGTDATILATFKANAEKCPALSCNLFGKNASALIKLLGKGKVGIQYNGNAVEFKSENFTFACPVVIGNYPNYERIIPQKEDVKATTTLKKADILRSATMVGICTSKTSKLVKMAVSGESMNLSGEDIDNGSKASGFFSCENAEFSIGLNIDNLTTALQTIPAEDIVLDYIDSQKPLVVTPQGEDNCKILLMPVNF